MVGATVLTLDRERPTASAVAWRDGTVIAVGDEDDVRPHLGRDTEVIDGAGAVAIPGLVDSHIHPFHGTELSRGVDLRGARTLEEVRARLRAEADRTGDGDWVLGHSVGYEPFRESGITAESIAGAVGGRPALLNFFDGHTALASTEALRRAGSTGRASSQRTRRSSATPAGGRPGRCSSSGRCRWPATRPPRGRGRSASTHTPRP